ncbi:nucleoside 2-deoxyribosyltransferase [Acidithiobacillus thiooxidans]|jgi:nucleoside 2-deoxyribosyltransferase|uniref:Nucleoside 2-deoxyribosyltransferase n=1 Tax=Acidithiobacillus thiooxidans ATCC 19377 TaxID=637390 RepID=A0A5P9XQK8_ACITH|nr:nucleoside 2-deoxyribosyltransferase [Acidithiobacillus thiooxidans]MBU2835267.1 nucleoside 2-deoxyribosyltransferase [Acidithiobacillus thiooxidans]QFX96068.1 hypothetical protein GCD22_01784 [Acidithiobacillus thiooxidans ATCC 19377]
MTQKKPNNVSKRKQIYIAGPDVFRLDWPDFARRVSAACERLNFEPLFPIPPEQNLDQMDMPGSTRMGSLSDADKIYRQCVAQIKKSDAVVANITPFRGLEPDAGTVFEIALAVAHGKPVVAYSRDVKAPSERLAEKATRTENGALLCADGFIIERFNLPCNLMIAQACMYNMQGEDVEKALETVQQIFDGLFL